MLFMVSVTFEVVSVWLVIEPCVKFGTTGTAWTAAAVVKTTAALVTVYVIVFPERMLTGIILNQLQ
jgi:hypothetical protein